MISPISKSAHNFIKMFSLLWSKKNQSKLSFAINFLQQHVIILNCVDLLFMVACRLLFCSLSYSHSCSAILCNFSINYKNFVWLLNGLVWNNVSICFTCSVWWIHHLVRHQRSSIWHLFTPLLIFLFRDRWSALAADSINATLRLLLIVAGEKKLI